MELSHDEHMNICLSLAFCLPTAAEALADGLDDMLVQVQERFGARESGYIIAGIEFGSDHPKVSYPHRPGKYALVRLSEGALKWSRRSVGHYALWQLAHETVHLLSPTPGERVNVPESG